MWLGLVQLWEIRVENCDRPRRELTLLWRRQTAENSARERYGAGECSWWEWESRVSSVWIAFWQVNSSQGEHAHTQNWKHPQNPMKVMDLLSETYIHAPWILWSWESWEGPEANEHGNDQDDQGHYLRGKMSQEDVPQGTACPRAADEKVGGGWAAGVGSLGPSQAEGLGQRYGCGWGTVGGRVNAWEGGWCSSSWRWGHG